MTANSSAHEYSEFAQQLALQAGRMIKNQIRQKMKKSSKKDTSPLTKWDIAINRMVIEKIQKKYPDHAVRGEEKSVRKKSSYTWWCDPIDGTIPFVLGIPISTFSLALIKDGIPVVGVIYDPFMNRMFHAEKGGGAFINKKRISISKEKTVKGQTFYMGWWKYSLYDLLFVRQALNTDGCKIMDFCSIAYAGALTAAGKFDGMLYADRYGWDVAAAHILIEEAGGMCTDFEGNRLQFVDDLKGFVAGNKEIHKKLLRIVRKNAVYNKSK